MKFQCILQRFDETNLLCNNVSEFMPVHKWGYLVMIEKRYETHKQVLAKIGFDTDKNEPSEVS